MKEIIPALKAKIPIFLANVSNFSCKGVIFSSFELSTILCIFPFVLFSPTHIITAFPFPSIQSVPDNIIGDKLLLFLFFTQFSYESFCTK